MDNIEPRGTVAATPLGVTELNLDMSSHIDQHATIILDAETSDTHNATLEVNGSTITVKSVDPSKYAIAEVFARSTKNGQPVELAQVVTLVGAPAKNLDVTIVDEGESAIPVDAVLRDVALPMANESGVVETETADFRIDNAGVIAHPKQVTGRGKAPAQVVVIGHAKEDGAFISVLLRVTVIPVSEA